MNQYVVIKYLGRGACGRVFLCMDMTDNRLYAVKVIRSACLNCLCALCFLKCHHVKCCHVGMHEDAPQAASGVRLQLTI